MAVVPQSLKWGVVAAYAALLIVVCVLPSGGGRAEGWDDDISPELQNTLHVPAFGALMLAAAWAVRPERMTWKRLAIVALACLAFATLLECAQAYVPGRSASPGDGLLNAAGILLGAAAAAMWRRTTLRRSAMNEKGLSVCAKGLEDAHD
jgi:hypothetical protein